MQRLLRDCLLPQPHGDGVAVPPEQRQLWVDAIRELLTPEAPVSVKAALLTAIHMRGEGADVIDVFREVLNAKAVPCPIPDCCDIVGTGGDGKNTFNISTPASIVAAAAGLRMAKHGNRSASANSGSADVVEQLGGCLQLSPEQVGAVARRAGYCFIFAPCFHPELRHVGPLRKELGFRTVFNLMGPVLNPCAPGYMVVGVGVGGKGEVIAAALARRPGTKRGLVVRSEDGLDKISPAVPTHSWLVEPGQPPQYRLIRPEDFGLESHPAAGDYFAGGGGPVENSARVLNVLSGRESGVLADFVLVQAAALAWLAGKAGDLREGMQLARAAVSGGAAARVLDDYVRASTQEGKAKSTDILSRIQRRRSVDLLIARQLRPEAELREAAAAAPPPVCLRKRLAEHGNQVGVLAELKRASPSEGDINASADVVGIAARYAAAGVQAISVLTEPVWFKGSLEDLRQVRQAVDKEPVRPALLRKDFVFSKYQVLEARACGADSVLLIVASLDVMQQHGETLEGLITFSRGLGMEPLVEVVTEEEVDIAMSAGARVIGVNNRDLKTFKVNLGRTGELIQYARGRHPQNSAVWVGLSGVSDLAHVTEMSAGGAAAVLVGTSLMRAADPGVLIKEWQNPRKRPA
eukprot:TRINITY_DN65224_c0_g1_i1.p1 TRINITY_DN65224_c0_g1~~TRINITY_DN65224_c0_g1_i1.p1  ORF type:complete len:662 (+),score=226.08 TRINITY_DN65224_c0_g1_i1:83-1987(+)